MMTFVIATAWLLCIGCGGNNANTASPATSKTDVTDQRGPQIVAEYLKRDAAPFRKNRVRFTITEEGEQPKAYEIESSRKQAGDETTTFTQIVSPAEDSGLGSLTLEAKDKKAVVVTYATSRGEFRETDTRKMFFGGLTVGELLGEWYKFDCKFISEKDLAGVKVLEVEGKLKSSEDSIASRITVLFRADSYLPVELHMFGSNEQEIRVYKTTKIVGEPGREYSARIEADNLVYKSHIVIERLTNEFPAKMDDALFVREKLKETVKK